MFWFFARSRFRLGLLYGQYAELRLRGVVGGPSAWPASRRATGNADARPRSWRPARRRRRRVCARAWQETLTVQWRGLSRGPADLLGTTNLVEHPLVTTESICCGVRRWRDAAPAKRWVVNLPLESELESGMTAPQETFAE